MNAAEAYCGEVERDGWKQLFVVARGLLIVRTYYATPEGGTLIWRHHPAGMVVMGEGRVVAEMERHEDCLQTLLVLARALAAMRRMAREATAAAREIVLAPSEWTHVDLSAETPS